MKEVYLLDNSDNWTESVHETKEELLKQYDNAILVMTSDHYEYYIAGSHSNLLYRVIRPLQLTKKEAEDMYNIKITQCW